MRETGVYQILGEMRYFIPNPLPPQNPELNLNLEIIKLYGDASHTLGLLNEMSTRIPNYKRFINSYIIKEGLLSSEIEGIHTTLIDVFTQSLSDAKPNKETQLVLNYTKALEISLNMIQLEGMPLVSRVILKAHEILMSLGEGDYAAPGQYRKQVVRVGELTPPPATKIPELISDLEKYMNQDNSGLPALIQSGLVHVQFETIHPFLDGNGRIGRLLIVLMLINSGLLSVPILYPSYYFKKFQQEYYQKLDRVRTHGDYEGWIIYYLKAIKESAQDAYNRAKEIEKYEIDLKEMIKTNIQFNKVRDITLLSIDYLFQKPVLGTKELSEHLGKTFNTAQKVLLQLMEQGLVVESTSQKRNKLYRFQPYLDLLEKEY